MSDGTIITMPDGGRWKPATSVDTIQCHNCDNLVDTPAEVASYPDGNCPDCGETWTDTTKRHTAITVTMPQSADGGVM